MVAMATTLFTVYCKLFHMMPYIIILKVRKFHQPTASLFSTARKKPVGGTHCAPPSLNRVKVQSDSSKISSLGQIFIFTENCTLIIHMNHFSYPQTIVQINIFKEPQNILSNQNPRSQTIEPASPYF